MVQYPRKEDDVNSDFIVPFHDYTVPYQQHQARVHPIIHIIVDKGIQHKKLINFIDISAPVCLANQSQGSKNCVLKSLRKNRNRKRDCVLDCISYRPLLDPNQKALEPSIGEKAVSKVWRRCREKDMLLPTSTLATPSSNCMDSKNLR